MEANRKEIGQTASLSMTIVQSTSSGNAGQEAEVRMGTGKTVERTAAGSSKESEEEKKSGRAIKGRKSVHQPQRQATGPKEDPLRVLEKIVVKGTTDVEKEIKTLRKIAEHQFLSSEGS